MARFFVTGDTHALNDIEKLEDFQEIATAEDYVIICGDCGVVWDDDIIDRVSQNIFNEYPWTTLFVDGNHENHPLLNQYPVEIWNGGRVHRISNKILHLMRGEIYEINGKRIFTMGGARSTDQWCRTEGVSWWKEELPSRNELEYGLDNLARHDYRVDYIISHCAPDSICDIIFQGTYDRDILTNYFEVLYTTCEWNRWYCGHYHIDHSIGNFNILYNKVIELGE